MKYLAIDQNKWIELDEARASPSHHPETFEVLEFLLHEVEAGRVTVPLFQSNIYETHKIDDFSRRVSRAQIQCALSDGRVVCGLTRRRSVEVRNVLARYFKKDIGRPPSEWFLTTRFWEAASLPSSDLPRWFVDEVDRNPAKALFSYLVHLDDSTRSLSVQEFSKNCFRLLGDIERRRALTLGQSLSLRRRALSVHLWMDSQDAFWVEVDALGISTSEFKGSSNELKRDLVRRVPCLHVERELTLVIEAEPVTITENDLRDMHFFTSAIPHMSVVVGERGFVSQAHQAGLDKDYEVALTSDLLAVPELLS